MISNLTILQDIALMEKRIEQVEEQPTEEEIQEYKNK